MLRRRQLLCAIRDGGNHETCVEVVRFRVRFAIAASMENAPRSHVPRAIRDGGIHEKGVEVVELCVKFAKETLVETSPEKSGLLCNPRLQN